MTDRPAGRRPGHPREAPPPCHKCPALCCRYYTVEIDPPEAPEDFDEIRWWLMHGGCWVWAEGDEWCVQVEKPCRHLRRNNQCAIYDERPQVCREYGLPEGREHPDDPLCDYFGQDDHHELELRTLEDVDAHAARVLARRKRPRCEAKPPRKDRPDRASRSGRTPDCRP